MTLRTPAQWDDSYVPTPFEQQITDRFERFWDALLPIAAIAALAFCALIAYRTGYAAALLSLKGR